MVRSACYEDDTAVSSSAWKFCTVWRRTMAWKASAVLLGASGGAIQMSSEKSQRRERRPHFAVCTTPSAAYGNEIA